MSYAPRPTSFPSHVRSSSGLGLHQPTQQTSNNLQTRINEKRLELESLKQLRDLSAGLAGQMQQLEEKLSTLSTGTEAVAAVMGNWATVLRAIHMASSKIPKPKDREKDGDDVPQEEDASLPQTLVRIPIQQAEAAQREEQRRETAGE